MNIYTILFMSETQQTPNAKEDGDTGELHGINL
jgi:hypothetical protein